MKWKTNTHLRLHRENVFPIYIMIWLLVKLYLLCSSSRLNIYDSRLIFQMIVTFRFYQVRCSLRVQPRLSVQIEASVSENSNKEISSATVIRGAGTSKIFQILYRNEEVTLKDTVVFRVRLPGNCHYTTTLVLQK